MARLSADRLIPYRSSVVWEVLSDFRHFARNDPYHHDFSYVSEQRRGRGTKFTMRHTYWPIYPFRSDWVKSTVTQFEPGVLLSIFERNDRAYRSHTQSFLLEPVEKMCTKVTFVVSFRDIPLLLLPWRLWVYRLVRKRLNEKLAELQSDCFRAEHAIRLALDPRDVL